MSKRIAVDGVVMPGGVGTSSPPVLVWTTTLWGVVLGCCFPILATFMELVWHAKALSWTNLLSAQAREPLLWIIDTAPLFLGLVSYATGVFRARHAEQVLELRRLLRQRSDQLDSTCADLARVGVRHRESQDPETARALVAEQDRAQRYFDLAGTMIVALDVDGCVTKINRKGCEVLGYPVEEILGKSWFEHFLPDSVGPEVFQVFTEMMADRLEGMEYVENQVVDCAGRRHLIAWHNRLIRDDAGRIVGSLASGEDITYQRASERALRRSEQKLAGMVASMQEGIVYADEDGIVQTVNPYFCDFVGVKAEQIVGQRLEDVHTPEIQANVNGLIADARKGNKRIYSVERELAGRHVTLRIQPVSMGDDFLGMVLNIHDITEQRTARLAAEEASRAKSSFLANVSHEIRTPMNGVLGMTAMLLETELTEEQQRFASTVQESAEALLGLINDVLDFSKVEAGKLTLQAQDFDWQRLLEGVRQILVPQVDSKQLQITCCGDPALPALLRGDESRLRQVLLNLGGNAVKFTEGGGVVLEVECVEETAEEVTVRFSVMDTGGGVAVNEQRRLFESFYQVDGSDTRQHGGSGLGLAICKQLVELMGGTIGLESAVGEGSIFWFSVTLARATNPATATNLAATNEGKALAVHDVTMDGTQSRSGRILVVDDNKTNRQVALTLLEHMGYEVVVARSGKQALTMTATPFFDLVLMDLQMPGMDGLETTRALRAEGHVARAGWALPVVALTAHARSEDRHRCLAAGMDDYLTKPLQKFELLRILDRHLPASASRAARSLVSEAVDVPVAVASKPTAKLAAKPTVDLASTSASLPVFCYEELMEMLGSNDDLLPELLSILREDTDALVESLRKAIADGASEGVVGSSHALKGVLGGVAGRAAAQTAKNLERLGRQHVFDLAEGELTHLEEQIAQLLAAIEDAIAQPVAQPA